MLAGPHRLEQFLAQRIGALRILDDEVFGGATSIACHTQGNVPNGNLAAAFLRRDSIGEATIQ